MLAPRSHNASQNVMTPLYSFFCTWDLVAIELQCCSLSSSFLTFFLIRRHRCVNGLLPTPSSDAIQWASFFGFWTVLLGRWTVCRVFTVAYNWAICNSICLIDIACVSNFCPILAKSHLNSLMCSSLASNLLISLCNISLTRAILSPPSLGVIS